MISQLRGMIVYEARMQWRRRVLMLLLLALLGLQLFITLQMIGPQASLLRVQLAGAQLEEALRLQSTVHAMFAVWVATTILVMAALPLVLADTIPNDRQYGMRELMDTLPVSPGIYLSGKIVGAWAVLLPGLLTIAIAGFVIVSLAAAPVEPGGYGLAWLLVTPLALFIATAAVVLPLGQPNRRRAVSVGFALFILLFAGLIVTQLAPTQGAISPIQFDTYAEATYDYYTRHVTSEISGLNLVNQPMGSDIANPSLSVITLRLVLMGAVIWLGGWGWLRWQKGK